MKIIDKNGKLFSKISVIDIIIVLVVVFLIGSVVYARTVGQESVPVTKQEIDFTITLKAFSVRDTQQAPFAPGEKVFSDAGELLGEIVSVEKKPTVTKVKVTEGELEDGSSANGTYVNRDSAEYVDYYLTVKGTGTETDKGLFASGSLAVIPNNAFILSSKYFNGSAIVLSVQK